MNQRGFSYIEVLMAAAILSIVMVPVISGFFLAGRNFQYAYDYYRANLEAQNILEQAQEIISRERNLSWYKDRRDIFGLIAPDSLSVLDFDYVLTLYKILEGGGISGEGCILESKPGLWTPETVRISTANPVIFKNGEDEAYSFYTFDGCNVITLQTGEIHENLEIHEALGQGPYVIFEKTKEPFESYLAIGSVYNKEGRLLKQMIKVLTTM